MNYYYSIMFFSIFIFSETWGQELRMIKPKHEIRKSIKSIVKESKYGNNPNWSIYSDEAMNNAIGKIKIGDSVKVLGWATWLYFIKAKDISGYISWKALNVNSDLDSLATVVENQSPIEEDVEIKKQEESERKKLEDMLVKKYGITIAQKILKGYYWIGMTSTMAIHSLGLPDKVNRTVTANSIHEQWIYRNTDVYLYFEDNLLTSYQDQY